MPDEELEQVNTAEETDEDVPESVGFKQFDISGQINPTLWNYGIEDSDRLPFAGKGMWRQIGPAPLLIGNDQIFQGIGPTSGTVVDIAIDPSGGDHQIMYIATANGGVWKTTDGGASWQPLTDFLLSSAIGAVALDPGDPNIVYAGTGNLFEASRLPKCTGLFKSIDGGATWAHMDGGLHATVFAVNHPGTAVPPNNPVKGINRIVCPTPGTVLVATDGGLFFSADGGLNFGANEPAFDDGLPLRGGFISALAADNSATNLLPVTDVTSTTPVVVTAANHGFQKGDRVYIGGVAPARSVNGSWVVDGVTGATFDLRDSLAGGAGATSGVVMGPAHPRTVPVQGADNTTPIVIHAGAHGFLTGDFVAVHAVVGNTAANGSWEIRVRDADHFELVGSRGNAAFTNGGIVDGPKHGAPAAITAAVNEGGIQVTVNGHGFIDGDQVTLTGLPGIDAPKNSGTVVRIDENKFRIGGMTMNASYPGGGTVAGPASAWNSAYFVVAGPGKGSGLFRITVCSDGGVVISENLMIAVGTRHAGAPTTFGRIAFAQSLLTPPSPVPRSRTLYLSVQKGTGTAATYIGFFVSNNLGNTWTNRTTLAPRLKNEGLKQSDYDLTIGVDPQDSTRVYAALQQLWRSTNSGEAWNTVTAATLGGNRADALDPVSGFNHWGHSPSTTWIHWDHHELVFSPPTQWALNAGAPPNTTRMYFGTDGGISRSDDGAVTYVHLNEGLATALLEDIDIGRGAGNNAATFGGMQDMGTAGHHAGDADLTWVAGIDGDGDYTAIDPASADTVLGFDNSRLLWTPNGGVNYFRETGQARPIITSVRNTNPVEVVTTGCPFRTGDKVKISGVPNGGTVANGSFTVTRTDNFSFTLNGQNGAAAPAFGPGPLVNGGRCLESRQLAVVTATSPIEIETTVPHGLTSGDQVHIEGVVGRTVANNTDASPFWTVTVISNVRFSLDGSDATASLDWLPGSGRMRGPRRPDDVPIQLVTNSTPIVVTAINHGFVSGDTVQVSNVLGTVSANTTPATPWIVTVIDSNSIILRGSAGAGDGAFILGPQAVGPSVGRNLGAKAARHRIAIEPRGTNPDPIVFVSRGTRLLRSTDGGVNFSAVSTQTREISTLTASGVDQLWGGIIARAASGAVKFLPGTVFFRGGTPVHFFGTADHFVSDIGARGNIAAIAVDPRNSQHVAVVVSGFSETDTRRRTRHCFVTTTGGIADGGARAWTEVGGVFDAPLGNLPDFPVLSVGWDNSTDPSTLLVASDAGVLRLKDNQWERVGPNLPNVSCQALRVDTSVDPPVIRVGTYGRSAWEFVRPTGPKLVVRGNLGFGERRVGRDARLPLALYNVGDATLTITSMPAVGDFSFDPAPGLPLNIAAGERQLVNVLFRPTTIGPRAAIFEIESNDPLPPPNLRPTGIGVNGGTARMSVRTRVDFGVVATGGGSATIPVEIANTGLDDLDVILVALDPSGSTAFTLPTPPPDAFVLGPGETRSVDVQFAPTAAGIANSQLLVQTANIVATVQLAGEGAPAGSANLVASIVHFLGLGSDDDEQGSSVLV